ncbi:dihydrofolate reductase family protein [Paeniglutamicibacter cryotolerans]|uniref:Dihydrofolate reductase n=1 Tax=Paeniglutamicibacter cryotolerans TaxID=670079 RepID=A0A839QL88_9MICC|nr:dihydrofolate reductase family protein [Paeniglutamicibacter cryotolerans]MBB2996570.1 dihydrofolate reductase [Paeniglutamicibacter cryotolerans]
MFATRRGRSLLGQDGGGIGVDNLFSDWYHEGIGTEIMGRGKFSPHSGPWTKVGTEDEWRGWWGPHPPFHTPVFALTHHLRPALYKEGGTVFHFLNATPQKALEAALEAAYGLDVRISGGPTVVRGFLATGLVDLLHVVQVPILLGRACGYGDGLEGHEEQYELEAISSPSGVIHLTFTRIKSG